MAEMKDMYKVVKSVDSATYDRFIEENKYEHLEDSVQAFVEKYKTKRKIFKLSNSRILATIASAIEHRYIRWTDTTHKTLIVTNDKGRHFLGRKFYFYRAGLIDDSLKAYGRSQRLFLGLGVGTLIGSALTVLVKMLWAFVKP